MFSCTLNISLLLLPCQKRSPKRNRQVAELQLFPQSKQSDD